MTTDALATLRHSRDDEHDAAIWHDGGKSIRKYATLAGVKVEAVTVDLTALTVQRWAFSPERLNHAAAYEGEQKGRAVNPSLVPNHA